MNYSLNPKEILKKQRSKNSNATHFLYHLSFVIFPDNLVIPGFPEILEIIELL